MQTLVKHEVDKGQYECMKCGSRNASIAGNMVTFTHFELHSIKQIVGVVYEGNCEDCKQEEALIQKTK